MKLIDTVEMMNSNDYKERFRAEYLQLKIRINGLSAMLDKYKAGTLDFKPFCSYELLDGQRRTMKSYADYLEARAYMEHIELPDGEA